MRISAGASVICLWLVSAHAAWAQGESADARAVRPVPFTANPDFAQVEADQLVLTVNQRFRIFYDEKRPFFLEASTRFTRQSTSSTPARSSIRTTR